jgi:hypothetical protein
MCTIIWFIVASQELDVSGTLYPLKEETIVALASLQEDPTSIPKLHSFLKAIFFLRLPDDAQRQEFLVFRHLVFTSLRFKDESLFFIPPQSITQLCSKLRYFIRITILYEIVVNRPE